MYQRVHFKLVIHKEHTPKKNSQVFRFDSLGFGVAALKCYSMKSHPANDHPDNPGDHPDHPVDHPDNNSDNSVDCPNDQLDHYC